MADKKLVEQITPMEEDFTKWYTDVCLKAELVSYSNVAGCVIFRPYGYALWEAIRAEFDPRSTIARLVIVSPPRFVD